MACAVLAGSLLGFSACGAGARPEGLIPMREMAALQADVHLAEASIQTYKSTDRDSMARIFYRHIFRIHGVSEADYYASLSYYSENPKSIGEIYEETKKILDGMEKEAKR